MQKHVSEAADPEDDMSGCFARGCRGQKMLFQVVYTFDDGERSPTRKAREIQVKNDGFPLFGRRPASTVFLLCLSGPGTMQGHFVYLLWLT
jgi:hypothetical protein